MRRFALTVAALLLTLAGVLLVLAPPLHAQSATTPEPLGIWRSTIDGIPAVILTLADDTGSLGGTVVFYAINGEQKQVLTIEPHTLLQPKLDGDTLTFQVRRPDAKLISFTVEFTTPTRASIHCLNCGDAPVAELTKDQLPPS